jgi:putative spermidine/putrescine transport system ATP-binding protein
MSATASGVRGEARELATSADAVAAAVADGAVAARPEIGASLRLDEVSREFGNVVAVDSVSLFLEPGRFLTILGPSGAGKSTCLHLVAGLLDATSGSIEIDGRSVDRTPPERRNVGLVFQNYALFPHLSVAQNLAFPLEMRGLERGVIKRRVAETLDLVGLDGLEARRPRQLSGGQQQRVALARVLIYRPQVVLMDEPLGALDRNLRQQMQSEINRLHSELGLTVVYVTHDQSEAMAMSDLIAVMDRGRLVQSGTPREVYAHPRSSFVATFLGEANLMPGQVSSVNVEGGHAYASVAQGLGARAPLTGEWVMGQPVTVVIRPEDIRVRDSGQDGEDGAAVRARVTNVAYVGDAFRVQVIDEQGHQLLAKLPSSSDAVPVQGDLVALDWSDARATFVSAD